MTFYFPVIFSFLLVSAQVAAFTFTFNPPSECDDLGLTWTGGTPPFQLVVIPVFGTPRDYPIPSSAFADGKGSYPIQLPLKRDQEVVFVMSDATGFNTGGSSNVFKVSQSKGGVCNSTDPGIQFSFQLNTALQQCRPFVFSGYDGAVQPVTIGAIIPGGNGIQLNPAVGDTSYAWNVNVAHGTSMIFFMTDSRGRQGGSSDVRIVGVSDDSTCLNNLSPASTTRPPGPSLTVSPPSPSNSTTPPPPPPSSISAAGIAGAIIGSVLFLSVVVTLALFVLKRASNGKKPKRRRIDSQVDLDENLGAGPHAHAHPYAASPPGTQTTPSHPFDSNSYVGNTALLPQQPYANDKYPTSNSSLSGYYDPSMSYIPSPALYPPQPNYQQPAQFTSADALSIGSALLVPPAHVTHGQPSSPRSPTSNDSSSVSAAKTKAAMAGTSQPPRFILHTDAEDSLTPNEASVVELPPQYSERRAPIRLDPPPPDGVHYPS